MTNARTWLSAAEGDDTAAALRAIASLRRLLDELESAQVRYARARGWSWGDLADVLGVSRQAVHHKHAHRS